jgi:hypothetical protein
VSGPNKLKRNSGGGKPTAEEIKRLEELATNLGRGKSHRTRKTWPGGAAEFDIRVLTFNEVESCKSNALKEIAESYTAGPDMQETIQAAKAKHMIARSFLNPDENSQFFKSAKELGDLATEDELIACFEMYLEHKNSVDPDLEDLSEEHLATLIEAIKKKDAITLRSTASVLPANSLRTLVDLLANSL